MTAITGAAIGFLVWGIPYGAALYSGKVRTTIAVEGAIALAFTGSGAAIGWLIGGAG